MKNSDLVMMGTMCCITQLVTHDSEFKHTVFKYLGETIDWLSNFKQVFIVSQSVFVYSFFVCAIITCDM